MIKKPESVDEIRQFWEGPPSDAFPQFYAHIKFLLKELEKVSVLED